MIYFFCAFAFILGCGLIIIDHFQARNRHKELKAWQKEFAVWQKNLPNKKRKFEVELFEEEA